MALRSIFAAGFVLAARAAASAQTGDSSPAFDVVVIKPAAPPNTSGEVRRMVRFGCTGGPASTDPGQFSCSFTPLKALIVRAYNLKSYQVTGPSSLDSERYDITAKVPRGTSKEDFNLMLQNMLKERFHLTFHREKKDLPVYALVVGKSGPKMKQSEDQSDPAAAPPPNTPPDGGTSGGQAPAPPAPPDPGKIRMGRDGMPELPPGVQRPGMMMMAMMSPAGARVRLNANRQTMAQLADSLSNQVERPVVDMTGLTVRYDFTLDFAPDQAAMMSKMPMAGPPPGAGGGTMEGGGKMGPGPDVTDAATVFSAIQEQLGLKLEGKKAPVDLLVVDSFDKTPTEN